MDFVKNKNKENRDPALSRRETIENFKSSVKEEIERQVATNIQDFSESLNRKHHKSQVGCNWRMDETYVKIKGQWNYLYRAVDKEGKTVDFYLSKNRDKSAAEAFFRKAIGDNMLPEKVVIDKSGANKAALESLNIPLALLFMMTEILAPILVRQIKYLNNLIEQDHRAIKKIINPMKGFKSFAAAKATIAGLA